MTADDRWIADLRRTDKGVPYPNHSNAVMVLQHDPMYASERLWYDEFLDRVIIANSPTREWRDEDDTRVTVDLQDRFGIFGLGQKTVTQAVRLVASQRTKHVIRDYLTALQWDGVERIALAFTDYWGAADDAYTQAASRNFLIGMVARILKPGCKLDTMPVFEGPQGVFKSSALEVLGGVWHSTTHETVGTKDFLQGLRGKWVVEIAELQGFKKAEVTAVKNTLSTRNDDYRKSHGTNVRRYPRECVFAGTTNAYSWGDDETGLRRFWPIRCGDIRIDLLTAARDQLFAEAVHAFNAGLPWWQMPDTTAGVQASRQFHDVWTTTIFEWIDLQPEEDGIRIRDLLLGPLKIPIERIDKSVQMRVAKILRSQFWDCKDETKYGKTAKVWRRMS